VILTGKKEREKFERNETFRKLQKGLTGLSLGESFDEYDTKIRTEKYAKYR